MSEKQRILVIGNGFDLAHQLKTKYEDFLMFASGKFGNDERNNLQGMQFQSSDLVEVTLIDPDPAEELETQADVREARAISWKYIDILNKWVSQFYPLFEGTVSLSKKYLGYDTDSGDYYYALSLAASCLYRMNNDGCSFTENCWLSYFKERKKLYGWSGFEGELKRIIRKLTACFSEQFPKKTMGVCDFSNNYEFLRYLDDDKTLNESEWIRQTEGRKRQLLNDLWRDMSDFIMALEIYLRYFAMLVIDDVHRIGIIEKINPIHVVSFNYTDTYHKIYGKDVPCTFIHGKLNETIHGEKNSKPRIVLGIDEFLPDDKKEQQLEFIQYRKFYQRILNKTGCEYKSLLKKCGKRSIQTVFYGHSMSEMDKEVLVDLLPGDQENIIDSAIICAYDSTAMQQQIAELVRIMGRERLVELMKGDEPRIKIVLNDELGLYL